MSGGSRISKEKAEWIIDIAKLPGEFYHEFVTSRLLIKNSTDSIYVNSVNGFILLSTINVENQLAEVKLVDLSKKKYLQIWQADFSQIDL